MEPVAARQAFNGCDLLLRNCADFGHARPLRLSINQNCAGTALTFPTAILAPGQI
jgi:hypothetical protein